MVSSSTPTRDINNTAGIDPQIEDHNRTLPLTLEDLAEYMPRPKLAGQFKEMQEHLLGLEASNNELEEKIRAKRVTL